METFWQNFWSNLFAGTIIAFLFGYLFVKWLDFYKRPKLSLVISDIKKLSEDKRIGMLTIRNSGKTSISDREANYHVYLPKEVNFDPSLSIHKGIERMGHSKIGGRTYTHYSQFNQKPIFPEREIGILNVNYKNNNSKAHKLYYHFSTAYGLMPKRGSCFRKINKKNGDIKLELLPYLELN